MKIFKFWVEAAIVLASALGVIGIISIIVFQVLYGWHTDILSPVEHLVKVLLVGGFKIAWVCVWLAIAKLLMLVYTGEVLTKDPIKPSKKDSVGLVKRVEKVLADKEFDFDYTTDGEIVKYARSILEAKNIPIPEKDEDLWKLIEPKVKQYTRPTTPEESFDPIHIKLDDVTYKGVIVRIVNILDVKGYMLDPIVLSEIVRESISDWLYEHKSLPATDKGLWDMIAPRLKAYDNKDMDNSLVAGMGSASAIDTYSLLSTIERLIKEHGYILDKIDLGAINQLQSLYFRNTVANGEYPSDALVWSFIEADVKKAASKYEQSESTIGVETPAYKSIKDRLTEVAKTPTQDADAEKP